MAVSLALNWSPPPSSPLFDEPPSPSGGSGNATTGVTSVPLNASGNLDAPPSGSSPPQSAPLASTSTSMSSSTSAANPSSSWSAATGAAAQQPRSYAAAAGALGDPQRSFSLPPSAVSQPSPSHQQYPIPPMPSYPSATAGYGQQQHYSHMPSFGGQGPGQPYFGNQAAWNQYQNSLAAQARQFYGGQVAGGGSDLSVNSRSDVGDDGRRRRTTSGPQKPSSHPTYTEAMQHYPAVSFAGGQGGAKARGGLPPGAMPPSAVSSPPPSSSSSSGGYHPYRRGPRSSDASSGVVPAPPLQFGQNAQLTPPAQPHRMRSSSTNSPSSAPLTYSSVASGATTSSGSMRNQAGLSHLRGSPQLRPTIPAMASDASLPRRPDAAARTDSSRSDRSIMSSNGVSLPHRRTESFSSSRSSLQDRDTGRSTPTPASATVSAGKKPSPLSSSGRNGQSGTQDDDDAEAVYGGSDDENAKGGRTTPTPGDKKKGFSNKLRKALSFSTLNDIQQAEAAAAAPDKAHGGRGNAAALPRRPGEGIYQANSSGDTNGSTGSTRSTSPPRTPDNGAPPGGSSSAASISSRRSGRPPIAGSGSGKRSLFNRKFNSSTDNISISSTVSSASVMLRKVGNIGKIARRHSLMGLTNMFNKDKEGNKDGLHDDDFGALPPVGSGQKSDESPVKVSSGKKDKSKAKKGAPVAASVSHATVELESSSSLNADTGMTPAASYVRQHQLQMRQQAEEERLERERAAAAAAAAAAATAAATAASANGDSLRKGNKTTDDVVESRQKMIEKEKERLKSKRGWRKKLGVGSLGSSSEAQQATVPTGLETVPTSYLEGQPEQEAASPYDGNYASSIGSSTVPPKQLGSAVPTTTIPGGFNDESIDSAFDDEELEPPHMPGATGDYDSGDEFETDSLRHWGEGIERSRESAARIKTVKGILKNSASSDNLAASISSPMSDGSAGQSYEKPFAGRVRANSYDAPQSAVSGGTLPPMSHLSTTTAATDRVDGVPRASLSEERKSQDTERNARPNVGTSPTSNMGHHSNSSMPTLSLMMNPSPTGQRSVTSPPTQRRRLVFADQDIYHSTWPAHVYDRRGELATCNRLTPLLAQRIKEELNTYKMEEMAVAPSSRIHTHFFV